MISRNNLPYKVKIHLLGTYWATSVLRLYHSLCLATGLKAASLESDNWSVFKDLRWKRSKGSQRNDERKCHMSYYTKKKRAVN